MNGAEFITKKLSDFGVTDVFGVPGGVVLDFLYAMQRSKRIRPHLCYHEQAAGFAALGYSQALKTLGVAYATRGPGFTNLVTPIAEAYQESLPVLFITAHSCKQLDSQMRMVADQEMDTVPIVKSITKYAARIDDVAVFSEEICRAIFLALDGRPGPVFVDISSDLFLKEVLCSDIPINISPTLYDDPCMASEEIIRAINNAKRPVILAGTGLKSELFQKLEQITEKANVPLLTSRGSQFILAGHERNFGYIGSHGTRYSNFILSKADLILALGNRMSFPVNSASYQPMMARKKTIRVDVDKSEFDKGIPNSECFNLDLTDLFDCLNVNKLVVRDDEWIEVCRLLRNKLYDYDVDKLTARISELLKLVPNDFTITVDVGNNEFVVSRAYEYSKSVHNILYSRSFGTLGCSLPKAIGAYYRTGKPVICFAGDQGIQFNIQELEAISHNKLPVLIVICNNNSSGMIKDHEHHRYGGDYIHVSTETNYGQPDFSQIAVAYGMEYFNESNFSYEKWYETGRAAIYEIVSEYTELTPTLPKGRPCNDMYPFLDRNLYDSLNAI